jgi:hypothetical protein
MLYFHCINIYSVKSARIIYWRKFLTFVSKVGSVLNYGAESVGCQEGKNIVIIHFKFLRKIVCVKKATDMDGLYGETGRDPMPIHSKFIMLKYWTKLICLKKVCLLNVCKLS